MVNGARIMKFGGAALAEAQGMRRVSAIVAAARGPRVVVASAMQGVTDELSAATGESCIPEADVERFVAAMRARHVAALEGVAPDGDAVAGAALESALADLERLLYGIAFTQEITPRLRDLVQSFGERMVVPVLAAALRAGGVPSVHLDADAAGVKTLGPFGNARPDLDGLRRAATDALGPLLEAGKVPVVTGYYGIDDEGNPTLFGRGGSDYVAALLGAALDAGAVELWKDVPGFLTADPDAVASARLVPELGYEEAAELAQVGAKVLHPRAVEPVQDVGIPIHIRCVVDPDAPGSVLRADVGPTAALVRSVASRGDVAVVQLHGPGMANTPGVAKRIFDALAETPVNVLSISTSQATCALLLAGGEADTAVAALDPILGGVVRSLDVRRERSLVCVVGRGLGATPGSAARILKAVADAGVNVEMITLGASDIAIDFIVRQEDSRRAIAAIHDTFLREVPA